MTACCTWIRHSSSSTPMNIRLYRASRTYQIASRARTVLSFSVTLTVLVPMTSQAEPSTILTISSSFATKELNCLLGNIHEVYYPNQISTLYLEKCYLQYKNPLIFRCLIHHLILCLRSLPLLLQPLLPMLPVIFSMAFPVTKVTPLTSPDFSPFLPFLPMTTKLDPLCSS